MAQVIKIKRSTGSTGPGSLAKGELAYSGNSKTLFIGDPDDSEVTAIGSAIINENGTTSLAPNVTAAEIRTLVGVDAAGTDNSTVEIGRAHV